MHLSSPMKCQEEIIPQTNNVTLLLELVQLITYTGRTSLSILVHHYTEVSGMRMVCSLFKFSDHTVEDNE